ncbi:hypothetical protein CPB85DRAFT_1332515, partial [Mucidula mucida]
MMIRTMTAVGYTGREGKDGKERTKDEFEVLGKECGWKLESVIPGPLDAFVFSV